MSQKLNNVLEGTAEGIDKGRAGHELFVRSGSMEPLRVEQSGDVLAISNEWKRPW